MQISFFGSFYCPSLPLRFIAPWSPSGLPWLQPSCLHSKQKEKGRTVLAMSLSCLTDKAKTFPDPPSNFCSHSIGQSLSCGHPSCKATLGKQASAELARKQRLLRQDSQQSSDLPRSSDPKVRAVSTSPPFQGSPSCWDHHRSLSFKTLPPSCQSSLKPAAPELMVCPFLCYKSLKPQPGT